MAVYCSRCGSENPNDSKFCFHCGARFAEPLQSQDYTHETRSEDLISSDDIQHQETNSVSPHTEFVDTNHKTQLEPNERGNSQYEFPAYGSETNKRPNDSRESYRFVAASFGLRFGAFLIDLVVLSFITQIAVKIADFDVNTLTGNPAQMSRFMDEYFNFIFTGKMGSLITEYMESFVLVAAFQMILVFAYYFIFHAMCGQTPGKFALGIKVTRTDGTAIGYGRSFFRYVIYWIGARFLYLGSFWALFNKQVATWHDLACDTRVYKVSSLENEELER